MPLTLVLTRKRSRRRRRARFALLGEAKLARRSPLNEVALPPSTTGIWGSGYSLLCLLEPHDCLAMLGLRIIALPADFKASMVSYSGGGTWGEEPDERRSAWASKTLPLAKTVLLTFKLLPRLSPSRCSLPSFLRLPLRAVLLLHDGR